MAPLTVLSDSDVKSILHSLTKGEVEVLQQALRKALNDYSTAKQNQDECAINQPERTVIESDKATGRTTTLFMPSTSSSGLGMKVVTLPAGLSGDRPTGEPSADASNATPQGALTVMANNGKPVGFINAEELTAFRTALASSLLMARRSKVKTVTVFGAGKQAYWHVRLALLLHGPTIRHVYLINHRFSERARNFFRNLLNVDPEIKKREGWWEAKFQILAENYSEYHRLVKQQIRDADIIFCMTPSTKPLFDHEILTKPNGRLKARLIIAVGSYKKDMIELPPEIIQQAVKVHHHGPYIRKRAEEGGVVLVDTIKCLEETGELTRAGLEPRHVVEIGEIIMLDETFANEEDDSAIDDDDSHDSLDSPRGSLAQALKDGSESHDPSRPASRSGSFSTLSRRSSSLVFHRRTHGPEIASGKKQSKDGEQMSKWLSKGNVIYKSVGLGLMDLCVGIELVRLAREKGIGTSFEDF